MSAHANGSLAAELSGVSKRFGKTEALRGVDLQVRSGELHALLGPNGAGKTTAIALMLGLEPPDGGEARLFGCPPLQPEVRRQVGVMMQEVALAPELRVREHVELTTRYYPAPLTADEAMERTHILALAHRPYGKLSAGQKRQAQFAMALCGRPRLLFLDEPTVGLDPEARKLVWRSMRALVESGAAVVLTTHYLEEAEALADRVSVLVAGRVIAGGSVDQLRGLVGRKTVTCSSTTAADAVRTWPGVESAQLEGGRLRVITADAETVVRRLLAADSALRELEVCRAGLADAFAELTGEGRS